MMRTAENEGSNVTRRDRIAIVAPAMKSTVKVTPQAFGLHNSFPRCAALWHQVPKDLSIMSLPLLLTSRLSTWGLDSKIPKKDASSGNIWK